MIDFRYHVVSIVAVFLALAVGIVLGSGPLKDDISGFLEDRTAQLAQEKVELQGQVSDLRSDLEYNEQFAERVQPVLVDDLLTGHYVTLVILPDAEGDQVDAVQEAVSQAGGDIAERVDIDPSWGDPEQSDVLGRVAEVIARSGRGENPYDLASQVLAEALLTPGGRVGEPSGESLGVLLAFENEGFLSGDDDEVIRANTVVVVGPPGDLANGDTYLVPMLKAFDEAGTGTVLAGPIGTDGPDGAIGLLRRSDLDDVVSSDDRLETVSGVTVTIAALAEQLAGGVGHYGTGDGSNGAAPDPFPRG